jgi:hypothetical protein
MLEEKIFNCQICNSSRFICYEKEYEIKVLCCGCGNSQFYHGETFYKFLNRLSVKAENRLFEIEKMNVSGHMRNIKNY